MLFDSPVYLLFLIFVVLVYWRLGFRAQNRFLLAASYFFYGWWDWRFLLLMIGSTIVDYLIAQRIAATELPKRRRLLLTASLVLNFSILGFFKYCNFFVDSFAHATQMFGMKIPIGMLQIVLPPGISFYTFQEVAYIVDVYKRKLRPSDSFVQYGLFISLFPHLIAGPIQRPSHLLPQVQQPRRVDWNRIFDGLQLIIEGLFRKCVIADNCALISNAAFGGQLGPPSIPVTLLAMYAFAWQIYGDFSGYSSIARGSAQLLGFHFMVNFRQPYLARSLQDFWRRWHISLSTWLRDYLYIPLGGSQHGHFNTYKNLMLTMLLGGLWHGANWTFVVWGGIHGGGLAAERAARGDEAAVPSSSAKLQKLEPDRSLGEEHLLNFNLSAAATSIIETCTCERTSRGMVEARTQAVQGENLLPTAAARKGLQFGTSWVRRIVVFHLVCIAWIFFRAPSIPAALHMLGGFGVWQWRSEYWVAFKFLTIFSLPLMLLDLQLEKTGDEYVLQSAGLTWRIAVASTVAIIAAFFGANQANAFIYFQF